MRETTNAQMENETTKSFRFYLTHRKNLLKTVYLVLAWIVMSIHIEILGPTLPIVARNVNVHYTEMGSALALRGIGYLIANLLGVFLPIIVKKHNQGLLIVAFLLSGLSVLSIPFVRSLIVLCVVCFLLGIGHGLTDLGGTKLLFSMWGMNSAAPLNIVRLGYGIGAILMNLFVQPFLPQSNLFVPYLITAILCFAIAIGYLIFYVREVQYEIVNTNEQENEKTVRFGWILSVLFILSAFFTYGNEQTFSTFLFSYLKSDKFKISTNQAIASTIRYWLSYCLGRLLTAVVCVFLSVEICLTLVWILGFVLAVVWLIFVWFVGLTQTSLVLLGAATGFVLGPIIPLTFAFFNRKVNVTPILLALVLCGAALGIMSFQKIAGFVMDWNSDYFPILLVVCFLTSILLYAISNIFVCCSNSNSNSRK